MHKGHTHLLETQDTHTHPLGGVRVCLCVWFTPYAHAPDVTERTETTEEYGSGMTA